MDETPITGQTHEVLHMVMEPTNPAQFQIMVVAADVVVMEPITTCSK